MVEAENAYFIRLGKGNRWAPDCLDAGNLKLDFREVGHQICLDENWDGVLEITSLETKSRSAAVSQRNQIQNFYKSNETTLWITFHADRLYWCFSKLGVSALPDGTRTRSVIDCWHGSDINGKPLFKNTLSGKLLAVEGFMGTICSVPDINYLLHKINGTSEPHVLAAQEAYENLHATLIPIIHRLHHRDLETLTDLIFRQSGWQRVGVSGGTERDIDLDLLSPVTGERIAVQVKSRADEKTWQDYANRFSDMTGFNRFYFVTHSPTQGLRNATYHAKNPNIVFWDENELAKHVVRGGLTGWLLDKAA